MSTMRAQSSIIANQLIIEFEIIFMFFNLQHIELVYLEMIKFILLKEGEKNNSLPCDLNYFNL
jgi:hypothetical protein